MYGHRVNDVTIDAVNYRIVRLAQPRSVLGHRIQHWLNVSGRASDDAQDLAGRRLPLQRPREFPSACAAIVCFSFATDSVEDVARRLRLAFLGGFLFIYKKPGWRSQSGLI